MADLSAIPPEQIRALEEAMKSFGVPGVTVDGNAGELSAAQLVPFLDKLSRALGAGDDFTVADYSDPAIRDQRIAEISSAVTVYKNSPQMQLVGEILKGKSGADFSKIEQYLTTLGVDDPAALTAQIQTGLNVGVSVVMPRVIAAAEELDPNFAKMREILGANIFDDVGRTVDLLAQSPEWFSVIDAITPDAATSDPVDVAAIQAEITANAQAAAAAAQNAPEKPVVHSLSDVKAAIAVVQQGLGQLIPTVQGELDAKREEVKGYLEKIDGTGEGFGNFIDDFMLLGQGSDLGRRLVNSGQQWAKEAVEGRLARVHDLPMLETLNLDDGVLDIREQTALQGVVFLMAEKFEIPGQDNWHYTPELGARLKTAFERSSFADQEKLVLGQMSEADRAVYDAKDEAQRKEFITQAFEKSKKGIEALLSSMDVLYNAGVLVPQRLYFDEPVAIPRVTREIFTDYLDAHQDNPAELNALNIMTHAFTDGLGLDAMAGDDFMLPVGISPIDPTQTVAERFAAMYDSVGATGADDFAQKVNLDTMLEMLDTMPFGTEKRREQFKQVFKDSLSKVREAEANGDDLASDILLSHLFGNAMESGLAAMDANSEMAGRYLFTNQRPITIDPRLDALDIQSGGVQVPVQEIFDLYKAQNDGFHRQDHQPLYFTDDTGVSYIAVLDFDSRVFQVEPLDLTAWESILSNTDRLPGENDYAYGRRVEELLREQVSGFDLVFQKYSNGDTKSFGDNQGEFPARVRAHIKDYAAMKSSVSTEIDMRDTARANEQRQADIKAGTPTDANGKPALRTSFGGAAVPVVPIEPSQTLPPPPPPAFQEVAAEMTVPTNTPEITIPGGVAPVQGLNTNSGR